MKSEFLIQDTTFSVDLTSLNTNAFTITSTPRDYQVTFLSNQKEDFALNNKIKNHKHPIVLADVNIINKYAIARDLDSRAIIKIDAVEENKNIETVLMVCEQLSLNNANRASMVFVIGGGILQDIGAFACCMYKRGIPWTFVPTTLLSQGDSCVGGKTAVNNKGTKNLLGLFSAPREVIIDLDFLKTLPHNDVLSGLGEVFRLLLTGGEVSFQVFEKEIFKFLEGDKDRLFNLVSTALKVKQQIVEKDEFELDLRRSMNYGHSIGHALEALTNYAIPHGTAVAIGILAENRISMNRGILSVAAERRISLAGRALVPNYAWDILRKTSFGSMQRFLASDKKVEGSRLKLATLSTIGEMIFLDLPLDEHGMSEVLIAMNEILA